MKAIKTIENVPIVANLRGITKLLKNGLRFICLFVNVNEFVVRGFAELEKFGKSAKE